MRYSENDFQTAYRTLIDYGWSLKIHLHQRARNRAETFEAIRKVSKVRTWVAGGLDSDIASLRMLVADAGNLQPLQLTDAFIAHGFDMPYFNKVVHKDGEIRSLIHKVLMADRQIVLNTPGGIVLINGKRLELD